MRFIKAAQATGFTLEDVAELLKPSSCSKVQGRIEERLEEVSARMKDLRHVQRVLKAALTTCQDHEPTGRCGVIDTLSASARSKQPVATPLCQGCLDSANQNWRDRGSRLYPHPSGCEQRIGPEPRFKVKGAEKRPGYGCLVRAEALRVSMTPQRPLGSCSWQVVSARLSTRWT